MSTPIASAFIRLRPDASTLGAETRKALPEALAGVQPAVDKALGSLHPAFERQGRRGGVSYGKSFGGESLRKIYASLRTPGGAAAAGAALGSVLGQGAARAMEKAVGGAKDFIFSSVAAARESQKIGALTAQVIKSTGGAAGVTAKQVEALSGAISRKTGIDDEAIQSSANLLLTFTNVANRVGKGNDIFNQATRTVQDMSVALGQSGKESAIQLGKALNDPIAGVSALARVGVTFTQQQKDQIKALVESGNTLGAQKVILKELGREFGGAAQAAATPASRLSVAYGNLKERIGGALIPVMNAAAKVLLTLSDFVGRNATTFKVLAAAIGPVAVATFAVNKAMAAGKAVQAAALAVKGLFIGAVNAETGAQSRGILVLAAQKVALLASSAATKAAAAAQWLLNVAMEANPIGLIIGGIIALGAGLVLAYKKSETFRKIVQGALHGVQVAAETVWRFIKNVFGPAFHIYAAIAKKEIGVVVDVIKGIVTVAEWVGGKIGDAFSAAAGVITDVFGGVKSFIFGVINKIIDGINLLIKGYNFLPGHKDIKLLGHLGSAATDTQGTPSKPGGTRAIALAKGGTVLPRAGGVPALLAEAGRAERVTPLGPDGLSDGDRALLAAVRDLTDAVNRGQTLVVDANGRQVLARIVDHENGRRGDLMVRTN